MQATSFPSLRTIADVLGGEVRGHSVLAPGPGHSKEDKSLQVTLEPNVKLTTISRRGTSDLGTAPCFAEDEASNASHALWMMGTII